MLIYYNITLDYGGLSSTHTCTASKKTRFDTSSLLLYILKPSALFNEMFNQSTDPSARKSV